MKKFMSFVLLLIVIGGIVLYCKNENFRKMISHIWDDVQNIASSKPAELEELENEYRLLMKEIEELSKSQEGYADDCRKYLELKLQIDQFIECFQKANYPDPLTESFDDPKYENLALKINGKTYLVQDAVDALKKKKAECDQMQVYFEEKKKNDEKLESRIARSEEIRSEIENLKRLIDQQESKGKGEDVDQRIDELLEKTQKSTADARNDFEARKKVEEEDEAKRNARLNPFEISRLDPAQITPSDTEPAEVKKTEKATFSDSEKDQLWNQMFEDLDQNTSNNDKE